MNLSRKFASLITLFFFYVLPIRKEVVFDNLNHAFPNFSRDQIKKIAYGSYKNFAITLVEILYLPWTTEEEIKKVVNFQNLNLILKKEERAKRRNSIVRSFW